MTINISENWPTPKNKVGGLTFGGNCDCCYPNGNPYALTRVLIALSWLSKREAKAVVRELRRTLNYKTKIYEIYSVTESVRGALNSLGLPFRPKLQGQVISLEPFMGKNLAELRVAAMRAKREDRLYPVLYHGDLHPRLVKVKRVEAWGILASTEKGYRNFRWENFEKTPPMLHENIGRLKERVSLSLTVVKPQPAPRRDESYYDYEQVVDGYF